MHIIGYAASIMNKLSEWDLKGSILMIDIAKAFATVPHHVLLTACEFIGAPLCWIQAIGVDITRNVTQLNFQGERIGNVHVQRGILEGSPTPPILYAIFSHFAPTDDEDLRSPKRLATSGAAIRGSPAPSMPDS